MDTNKSISSVVKFHVETSYYGVSTNGNGVSTNDKGVLQMEPATKTNK